jgi:hypothetical protein
MRSIFPSIGVFPVVCMLAGCGSVIHQTDQVAGDSVLSVDAKQRVIVTAPRPLEYKVTTTTSDAQGKPHDSTQTVSSKYRAFCAEPSPDVFAVLSQAASASGSLQKEPTAASAALQAALTSTESGATIARTQTVNMLRELMYRTCERYLSGALNDEQFPIQAVRDQHLMVSILAIEQLTGVVTPRTVALTGTSSGNAGQPTSEAIVRLDDAWKGKQSAEANKGTAQSKFDELEGADPKCSKLLKDVQNNNSPAAGTPEAKKLQDCNDAQSKLTQAEKERQAAADRYDALKTALAKGGAAAVASSGQASIGSDATSKLDAQTIQTIAQTVDKIVAENFQQDEFLLFCIRVMKDTSGGLGSNCLDYVSSRVKEKSVAAVERSRATEERAKALELRIQKLDKQLSK